MVQIGEFFMIRELYNKGWSITSISDEQGLIQRQFVNT